MNEEYSKRLAEEAIKIVKQIEDFQKEDKKRILRIAATLI